MPYPMSLKNFKRCKKRDFENGATIDDIAAALKERETLLTLCTELDAEMDGVSYPATAAAIMGALRIIVNEHQ